MGLKFYNLEKTFTINFLYILNKKGFMMSQLEFLNMLRSNYNKMLLTKKETAKELNVSEASIDRLRQNGQLSSKKILGQVMFSLDEIARFLYEA
jgi:vacuolar-type H+-ATPase subunit C/Vma6